MASIFGVAIDDLDASITLLVRGAIYTCFFGNTVGYVFFVAAMFDLRAIGVSGATLAVLRSSFLSVVALDEWVMDVSARTLRLLPFDWIASVLLRLAVDMAATEHDAFSPCSTPPIFAVVQVVAMVVVATEWPNCITLLRSFFRQTAGNGFSCDLKNPVIFVCDPKFGGLKMCCGAALPPATFGAIAVPPPSASWLPFLSLPLEVFVIAATAPLAVLLLPSHAKLFATLFDDELLSDRLRFVTIELSSVSAELPRIRFGLIVLIDVNNDNNGAVVDTIFFGLVCVSAEMVAATVFLGNDGVASVLPVVLIDDTDVFAGGFTNVFVVSTSGFDAAVAETTKPEDAVRFERW